MIEFITDQPESKEALNWMRENAPAALQGLPDSELEEHLTPAFAREKMSSILQSCRQKMQNPQR